MTDILLKIIPVILVLAVGHLLKRFRVVKMEDGDLFLRLVFYIALPCLILSSVSNIDLHSDLLFLPLAAATIIFAVAPIAFVVGRLFHLPRPTLGTFIIGATIMNTGFLLPFFASVYGSEGVVRSSLFDLGNGFLTFTFVYFLAYRFGSPGDTKGKSLLKKFLISPPLWAFILGLLLNITHTPLPALATNFFQLLGGMALPLILLSLGIYFKPTTYKLNAALAATTLRMGLGFLLGLLFVTIFNIEGLNRTFILIASAAPVGYNTLTFSSLEKLDKEFAASLVSLSLLLGLILVPILLVIIT